MPPQPSDTQTNREASSQAQGRELSATEVTYRYTRLLEKLDSAMDDAATQHSATEKAASGAEKAWARYERYQPKYRESETAVQEAERALRSAQEDLQKAESARQVSEIELQKRRNDASRAQFTLEDSETAVYKALREIQEQYNVAHDFARRHGIEMDPALKSKLDLTWGPDGIPHLERRPESTPPSPAHSK